MAEKTLRVIACDHSGCTAIWEIPPEYGTSADVTPPGWFSVRQRPEAHAACYLQGTCCSLTCLNHWAAETHAQREAVHGATRARAPLYGSSWYPAAGAWLMRAGRDEKIVRFAAFGKPLPHITRDPHMEQYRTE